MKKKFFLIGLLFVFPISGIIVTVYAIDLFNGVGQDNNNRNEQDSYQVANFSDSRSRMDITSRNLAGYSTGERFTIVQPIANFETTTSSGFIVSDQYGDLYISGAIVATKSAAVSTGCLPTEMVSYDLSGSLYSFFWGDFVIQSSSYYCPASKKLELSISSDSTESFTLTGLGDSSVIVGLTDARGNSRDIATSELFSSNKIAVTGLVSLDTNSGALNELTFSNFSDSATNNNFVALDYKVSGKLANIKKIVQKNLRTITQGRTPISTNASVLEYFSSDGLDYYDLSNSTEAVVNNNAGTILTLGTGGIGASYDNIEIDGENVLYVKGGNLYIKADLYNKNSKSILTIVVERDSNDITNGGNIYVDPGVTNIDAILIADGSMLSFNGSNILTTSNISDINALRNQLLIYGKFGPRNTFGEDKAIYGTDHYINNESMLDTPLYNLENLRSFEIMPAENHDVGITPINCSPHSAPLYLDDTRIMAARDATKTQALTYAFAGKKKCYYTDDGMTNLRTTEKIAAFVLEENPNIPLINPRILQN